MEKERKKERKRERFPSIKTRVAKFMEKVWAHLKKKTSKTG